ncbi:hypothetical protein Tco_1420398 [Tanacetum coccineum]
MDFEEPTFENVANDVGQPTHTGVDETHLEADHKIPKKDWFKDSPKPKVLDPEWNIVKDIDGTPKHPWFNKIVQAVNPPLTFDELMMFNLLKGTCKSCVELEYNMEEYKEGRLVIHVEFFFNNDLEYLTTGYKERTYSSSIPKAPAARYTMEGIEDMILTLWSLVVLDYDKDAALGITH